MKKNQILWLQNNILWNYHVSEFSFCHCVETLTKNNLGKKGFISAYSSRFIIEVVLICFAHGKWHYGGSVALLKEVCQCGDGTLRSHMCTQAFSWLPTEEFPPCCLQISSSTTSTNLLPCLPP